MKKKNSLVLLLIAVLTVMMVVSAIPAGAVAAIAGNVLSSANTEGDAGESVPGPGVETGNPKLDDTVPVGQPGEEYTPTGTGITTAEEFDKMDPNGSYYLAGDITVDTTFADFRGVFDGNGHTVTVSVPLFFAPQGATIKNLTVEGSVTAVNYDNTAAVASGTSNGCNFFNILNKATVAIAEGDTGSDSRASGIAGRTGGYTVIERCKNEGAITGYGLTAGILALASADIGSELVMMDCLNTGAVTSVNNNAAGLACGVECPIVEALIYHCRNEGTIIAQSGAGGMTSYINRSGNGAGSVRYTLCSNTGKITARENNAAGMVANANSPVTVDTCENTATGVITAGHESTSNQRKAASMVAGSSDIPVLIENCINYADIEGSGQSGGIAGWLQSGHVTLRGCVNRGVVTSRLNYCAGIIGRADHGKDEVGLEILIEDCTNYGDVTSYKDQVGGIWGYTQANADLIRCTNYGNVGARADTPADVNVSAGGIAGQIRGDSRVEDCRNEGNVTAHPSTTNGTSFSWGQAGGLIASYGNTNARGGLHMLRCVNTGNVTIGTIASGNAAGNDSCYAGGLVGYQYCAGGAAYPEIRYCMSTGNITAGTHASYAVGYMNGAYGYFYDNVFAGTLTSVFYPSGKTASGSPVIIILAWDQGNTLGAARYARNYVPSDFNGVVVNNIANTGSGTPVSFDGYAYTYNEEEKTAAQVYAELLEAATTDISTAAEFADMDPAGSYRLTADITLTATYAKAFNGRLDGNGHKLTVSAPVFNSVVGAEIRNLTLEGTITGATGNIGALAKNGGGYMTGVTNRVNITASGGNTGGLIGGVNEYAIFTDCVNNGNISATSANDAGGIAGKSESILAKYINCTNHGSIKSGTGTTGFCAGGIVGESQMIYNVFTGCVNTGTVTTGATSGNNGAGGIFGYNGNGYVYITDCRNDGAISGRFAGGMVGDARKGFIMTGCLNTGAITSTSEGAGGIYNSNTDTGRVMTSLVNCVNTGTVSGKGRCGGIAGLYNKSNCAGVTLTSCVNTGNVTSENGRAGGIMGEFEPMQINCNLTLSYCVNTGNVKGAGDTGGLLGGVFLSADGINPGNTADTVLTYCANYGAVESASTRNVGGLVGYAYTSDTLGVNASNCVIAGSVTGSGDSCSAFVGYANSKKIVFKHGIIVASLTATNTYLYYGTNGAAMTATGNIENNLVLDGIAMYDAYRGNGTTKVNLGTFANGLTMVGTSPVNTDTSKLTREFLLVSAGMIPGEDGTYAGLIATQLAEDDNTANEVGVYDAEGTEVAKLSTLDGIEDYLENGYTVKLLTDYYSGTALRIAPRGVNWTLDGNGHAMYLAGGSGYRLTLTGDGSTLTAENLTVYAEGYGVQVGEDQRVITMDATLRNAKIYAGGRNAEGYTHLAAGIALSIQGDNTTVKLVGENTTMANSSETVLYVRGGLYVEDGTFNSRISSLVYVINSRTGQPIVLKNGNYTSAGNVITINNVSVERTIEIFDGKYASTSAGNCVNFGSGNSRANVTVRIYNGEFENAQNGNLFVGNYNASSESNGTLEVYGGKFKKSGTSRLVKYYGNQNFYFYGGTFTSTSDDIVAFGLPGGVSNCVTESHIIFGTPADFEVPEGVTVQPLVIDCVQSLFYCDSLAAAGEITVDIYSGSFSLGANDAGISVRGNSAVTIHGGTITMVPKNEEYVGKGGLVQVRDSADLTIKGGTLTQAAAAIAAESWKSNIILVESGYTGDIRVEGGVMTGNNCGFYLNSTINGGTIVMIGGEMTTVNQTLYLQGKVNLDIELSGGKLVSNNSNVVHIAADGEIANPNAFNEATAPTFLLKGEAVLDAKGGSAMYIGNNHAYIVKVEGGTLTATANAFDLRMCGKLIIDNVTATTAGVAIELQNLNDVEINGGEFTVTGKNYVLRTNSSTEFDANQNYTKRYYAPRKVVINNGNFVTEGAPDACLSFEGVYDSNTEVIINGGYFENRGGMCVARVLAGRTKNEMNADNTILVETGTTLTIKGGVFVLTAEGRTENYCAVIRCGGGSTYGTVIIEGGTFIDQKTTSAQVILKNNTCATLNVTGGKFLANAGQTYFLNTYGNANVTTEGGYTPSCSHEDVEIDTVYAQHMTYANADYYLWLVMSAVEEEIKMTMTDGAQVRMNQGSTGIRFVSTISADKVEAAKRLAGENGTVGFGTVIAPIDYVMKAGAFTMEALEDCTELDGLRARYVNIVANKGLYVDSAGNVEIRCSLTNIQEKNYDRGFAAVSYVRVETAEGEITYFYGTFDTAANVRTIRQISAAALADVSDTATGIYVFLTEEGKYSRYNETQRAVLKAFLATAE